MLDHDDDQPTEPLEVKRQRSADISEQVAAYLATGGKVTQLPPCATTVVEAKTGWPALVFGSAAGGVIIDTDGDGNDDD